MGVGTVSYVTAMQYQPKTVNLVESPKKIQLAHFVSI